MNEYSINKWLTPQGIVLRQRPHHSDRGYKPVVLPVEYEHRYTLKEFPEMYATWEAALLFYETDFFEFDSSDVIASFLHYSSLFQHRSRGDSPIPDDWVWSNTGNEDAWEACNQYYQDYIYDNDD